MTNTIFGPFDERYELRSAFEGAVGIEPPYHHDPVLLASYLRRFLDSPSSRDALRRALMDDPAAMGRALSDEELCELVAMRLSMGVLRLVVPGGGGGGAQMRHVSTGGGEAQEDEQEEEESAAAEVKLRDWKLECKHHSESKRPVFERHTSIQVVPDKGQTKDTVKVHWRDDNIALPPALTVRTAGRADVQAQKAGANGPYSLYGYDVEYLGDLDNILFPLPSFWQALNEKTTYSFAPGPQTINVEVYNPRRWELEIKFPALQSFKGGYKYSTASHEVSGDSLKKLSMTKKSVVKETFEVTEAGWKPSSKRVDSVETKTTVTNGVSKTETEKESKLFDAIALKRDGGNLKIDAVKIASSILKFIKEGLDLVKLIKSYAPQVGWYVDLDIQVMQGGLAAEWYWKEWEDHTVFRYIDVKAMLEVFSITFEIGVGVSAFSFKLQVFGQVSGGVGVEISATRWKPEGAPGMNLGPVKGRIAGAIGARAEAGYFFKLEAKMETALELDLVIGINQPSRAVSLDGGLVWTGIQCEATGSVGAAGIGGTKKWKGELVGKSDRLHFEWPKPVEFKPPYMSRDAIAAELRKVLTNGWNVRVFTPSGSMFTADEAWSIERIAETLAERIERDRAFHRTPDMVEALGVAIRQDLDVLGTRTGRDYIESARFLSYVNGSVDGKSLVAHLNDGASPIRKLTGA